MIEPLKSVYNIGEMEKTNVHSFAHNVSWYNDGHGGKLSLKCFA